MITDFSCLSNTNILTWFLQVPITYATFLFSYLWGVLFCCFFFRSRNYRLAYTLALLRIVVLDGVSFWYPQAISAMCNAGNQCTE